MRLGSPNPDPISDQIILINGLILNDPSSRVIPLNHPLVSQRHFTNDTGLIRLWDQSGSSM